MIPEIYRFDESEHFLKEELYIPHFQPIINTINRSILGYEVLGRIHLENEKECSSLGPYFHDKQCNLTEKIYVDRIIREKAIKHLKNSGINTKLFLNFMPNILSNLHKEDLLDPNRFHLIQLIEKYDIDTKNIIIEITEDEFSGKIERLLTMIEIFRDYGFKIAIDDMGAGFSNLERIGYIHPDIIKVDIRIMRESLNNNSFRQVLTAISEMSLKLGCELLFEGIEIEKELTLALSMGANLLQGFYFSKASSDFQENEKFADDLKIILEKFSGIRFLEIIEECMTQQEIVDVLFKVFEKFQENVINDKESNRDILRKVLQELPPMIEQVFLSDLSGYQISPTYKRIESNKWTEIHEDIGNNYAWKPYFIKHKAECYFFNKKWDITKPLYDIENQNQYVIFTFGISFELILIAKARWFK